jgi:hypothetical protein
MQLHEFQGKAIQFNSRIELGESDFVAGQKAIITDYKQELDGVVKLTLDFSSFLEHNKALERPCYYDKNSIPSLKWSETKFFPKNFVTYEYFMTDEILNGKGEFEVIG